MSNMRKAVSCLLAAVIILGSFAGCAPEEEGEETGYSIKSDLKSVNAWDSTFDTTVTLTGYKWANQVSAQDVMLTQAFSNMAVDNIERMSDTRLKISAQGEQVEKSAYAMGTIVFAGDAVVDPDAEEKRKGEEASGEQQATDIDTSTMTYSVDIAVADPEAEVSIKNTGGTDAVIAVALKDCEFTDAADKNSFSFEGAQNAPVVSTMEKKDGSTIELTLTSETTESIDALYEGICDAALCISGDAVSTGKEMQAPVGSYGADLAAQVDYVEETDGGLIMTILLSCSNGIVREPDKKDVAFEGDIGSVSSLAVMDDETIELKTLIDKKDVDPDTLTIEGNIRIKGQWGENLWGTPCADADVALYYTSKDDSKELLAVDTGMAYDLLKAGLKSIAFGIGREAGGRLMEAMNANLFTDETVKQLTEMNNYLQKIDAKWTNILEQVNSHLNIMEDKIGSNNCSRVLDEYDTLASTLQATVLHLNKKKAALDAAEKETPEYEAAKQEYINAVDKEPCKVYTNTYVIGQKILKGSAGLAAGVVGTYDEMLSLIYNFDVQTYRLKEEFRIMTLALYMEAYDHAVLYYQLTDPGNELLKQLESQLVSISQMLDGMKVVRRTDDRVYCYAAGTELSRFAGAVGGNGSNYRSSIDETIALNMINRAKYRNTTLGADLDQAGFYTVNEKTYLGCDILVVSCVNSKKYTSKKREWWTTMTEINIRNHEVKKDVRTYYQRQEYIWYNFDWKQKECWGVYTFPGFRLSS